MRLIGLIKYLIQPAVLIMAMSYSVPGYTGGMSRPYAEWASPHEFPGASESWKQKKAETTIPLAREIAIPRLESAKLIRLDDYRKTKNYLSRMVLATSVKFDQVVDWYKNELSAYCIVERDLSKKSITFAKECKCKGLPIDKEPMCLFTTTPNVTIREVAKDAANYFGKFRTLIEVAYP